MGEIVLYEYNFDKPELSNELLIHYGIKGMHWGVRRYQNYDGTRIKGGKRVINKKKLSKYTSSYKKRKANKKAANKAERERLNRHREEIGYMNAHADKYSTKDINDKLNRVNAETRLSTLDHDLNPRTMDRVKKIVNSKAFKAVAITALAAGVVVGAAAYNKRSGDKAAVTNAIKEYMQFIRSGRHSVDPASIPRIPSTNLPSTKEYVKAAIKQFPGTFMNIAKRRLNQRLGLSKGG